MQIYNKTFLEAKEVITHIQMNIRMKTTHNCAGVNRSLQTKDTNETNIQTHMPHACERWCQALSKTSSDTALTRRTQGGKVVCIERAVCCTCTLRSHGSVDDL